MHSANVIEPPKLVTLNAMSFETITLGSDYPKGLSRAPVHHSFTPSNAVAGMLWAGHSLADIYQLKNLQARSCDKSRPGSLIQISLSVIPMILWCLP